MFAKKIRSAPFTYSSTLSTLSIQDVRIWVHLGCTAEERYSPQAIRLDIEFLFSDPPLAIETDQLTDTICYAHIVKLLEEQGKAKHFNLIEHLTFCFYQAIQNHLLTKKAPECLVQVKVTKLSPPVAGVHGGVSFCYSKLCKESI